MSLPSTKPAQTSIRSFFSAKTPKYAPPPSQAAPIELSRPPPPSASAPPPTSSSPDSTTSSFEIPPLPTSLPEEASIRLVSHNDVNALRRINALLLPVSYPDNFYQRAVDPSASGRFSRVITWAHNGAEPKVVGGVVCRVEPILDSNNQDAIPQNLYIQSLCLLSPYRSLGLVNAAVDNIIATAVSDPNLNVATITAHVWTENEEGLKWYEGRGFKRENRPIEGYYIKLRPGSAWLVSRPTGASVRNLIPSSSSTPQHSIPASATAAVSNMDPAAGPPTNGTRPAMPPSGKSYQNQRPETEWNDLPEDMANSRLAPPPRGAAGGSISSASSRSSSAARKKRDRSYPAAAFGN